MGGGKLVASGRMWVATEAEFDQRAVRMHAEGAGLPAEAILKRYLPPVRSSWSLYWSTRDCEPGQAIVGCRISPRARRLPADLYWRQVQT